MGLKEYTQVINGITTTVLLSDEDAKRDGLTKRDLFTADTTEAATVPVYEFTPLTPEEVLELRSFLDELRAERLVGEEGTVPDDEKTDEGEKQAPEPQNKQAPKPADKAAPAASTK